MLWDSQDVIYECVFPAVELLWQQRGLWWVEKTFSKSCCAAPDLLCRDSQFAALSAGFLLVLSGRVCVKAFLPSTNEWRISIILKNNNLFSCHALITLWLHCLVWGQNQQGLEESSADLSDTAAPAIALQLPGFSSALQQDHVVTLELAWA